MSNRLKVRFAVSVGLGPPDPVHLGTVVERVEALGFDTLWMSDVPSLASTDPSVGVAYAAARTGRLHLGLNLIPFGSTAYLVAHRLAQLDRIAGGRLLVTLVPGLDLPGERDALGTAGRHRGRMMDEIIPVLRDLWAGGEIGGLALPVRPVQDPLELWLGGSGPEAIARAGRVADGWLGSLVSPNRAGQIRAAIQDAAGAAGRTIDPEHFGLSIAYARHPEDIQRAARLRLPRRRPAGDTTDPAELIPIGAEALRAMIGELVEEGLSKFVVRPLVPPDDWDTELGWLADTVLDLQT